MSIEDIRKIIYTSKQVNLTNIVSNDEVVADNIKSIYEFTQNLEINYSDLLQKISSSNIRFCDYYDSSFHSDEIIDYFNDTYKGEDIEDMVEVFSLYVALNNITDLIFNYDLCDNLDELYELLDNNHYFEDILHMITYINDRKLLKDEQQENQLEFLNEQNKYKILFTGFSQKDISNLKKSVKKSLINKVSSELAKKDIITLAESVESIKSTYNFPLFRIHLANDYRVAYIRKSNVTAILGVSLKTGKDSDYTRYDSIAKNSGIIYEEIEQFNNGNLSADAQHFQVLEDLTILNKIVR